MENKEVYAVAGVVVVALFVFLSQNSNLSGNASKSITTQTLLGDDEYFFRLNEVKVFDNVAIRLVRNAQGLDGTGAGASIIEINGVQKSVNEGGGRVIEGFQFENLRVRSDGAIFKIFSIGQSKEFCNDSDQNDIYVFGTCKDRFYPDGVSDFCDFNNLREYGCGYDRDNDEIHCLSHVVECIDGCRYGACASG